MQTTAEQPLDTQAMNEQLLALYSGTWEMFAKIKEMDEKVSFPLFMKVPAGYPELSHRLLVIGQETHGWHRKGDMTGKATAACVTELMNVYEGFNRGANYRPKPFRQHTPFWQGAYRIQDTINPHAERYSFLATNLVQVDRARGRAPAGVVNEVLKLGLLAKELEITRPTAVVFLTGPRYDKFIRQALLGTTLHAVQDNPVRHLAQVRHPALPPHTYRTYHPAYLARRKQFSILDEINALVTA